MTGADAGTIAGTPEAPPSATRPLDAKAGPSAKAVALQLLRPIGIYLVIRAAVLLVVSALALVQHKSVQALLGLWDSMSYVRVAELGYPRALPPPTAPHHVWAVLVAFFPGYPVAIKAVHLVTGLGYVKSAYAAALIGGLAGAVLIWLLVRELYGPAAADRATALVFCFPGAYVLSMTYSETLLIPLAAGTLLALRHRLWWLAGLLAAGTTATDPTGVAIVVPCIWAAAMAIKKRRDWWALLAPVLAPAGIVAYFAYLWAKYGSPFTWFKVERTGWQEHASVLALPDQLRHFFHYGFMYPNYVAMAFGALAALLLVACAVRGRVQGTWLAYGLAVFLICLLTPRHGFLPRPVLHAFPLIAFAGARLGRYAFTVAIVFSALLLAAVTVTSLGSLALTP